MQVIILLNKFLLITMFLLFSCQKSDSDIINPNININNSNEKINSNLIYIKQTSVGQLIISQVKDDKHSNIYILNEPDHNPFTNSRLDGLVLEDENSLTVIDFDSGDQFVFSNITDETNNKNIIVNGFGLYSSDLPADLEFILENKSFYQSAYMYYCNNNDVTIDSELLSSLSYKTHETTSRDGVVYCGSIHCSKSYTVGPITYTCVETAPPGFKANCYFISELPFVICEVVRCPPVGGNDDGDPN